VSQRNEKRSAFSCQALTCQRHLHVNVLFRAVTLLSNALVVGKVKLSVASVRPSVRLFPVCQLVIHATLYTQIRFSMPSVASFFSNGALTAHNYRCIETVESKGIISGDAEDYFDL